MIVKTLLIFAIICIIETKSQYCSCKCINGVCDPPCCTFDDPCCSNKPLPNPSYEIPSIRSIPQIETYNVSSQTSASNSKTPLFWLVAIIMLKIIF
uniref:Uncharacterized protein n=1 Tax=Panagrolaimus sp. PS1159 TaxID=55785 RepID=A0AC35FK54_9BILA